MSRSILVLADIHGNLEALKAVLKDASGLYNEIWVLGDIAGYGPDPGQCLELLRRNQAVMVAGNHDLAACGRINTHDFNHEAKSAIELHKDCLSEDQKSFLGNLPVTLKIRSVTLSHGSPENPIWGYILDDDSAARVFMKTETSLTLTGHTHIPALWAYDSHSGARFISFSYGVEINYSGVPHLANPGSVGQSRDNDISARYIILNPEKKRIIFRRCSWKSGPTRRKMKSRGYPLSLIDRMAPKRPAGYKA